MVHAKLIAAGVAVALGALLLYERSAKAQPKPLPSPGPQPQPLPGPQPQVNPFPQPQVQPTPGNPFSDPSQLIDTRPPGTQNLQPGDQAAIDAEMAKAVQALQNFGNQPGPTPIPTPPGFGNAQFNPGDFSGGAAGFFRGYNGPVFRGGVYGFGAPGYNPFRRAA